ncbi:hypothetical protein CBS147346_1682 [Aspergillus niger]|nr:hypothetical protein CBS147346_1682 [Aspergillus niger]
MAPIIFGQGAGPFNRYSMQLPSMIADALSSGIVSVIEQGDTGRKGIYFCETGEHSHREFLERLATAAYELGVLPSSNVKEITLGEAAEKLVFGGVSTAELGYASK